MERTRFEEREGEVDGKSGGSVVVLAPTRADLDTHDSVVFSPK